MKNVNNIIRKNRIKILTDGEYNKINNHIQHITFDELKQELSLYDDLLNRYEEDVKKLYKQLNNNSKELQLSIKEKNKEIKVIKEIKWIYKIEFNRRILDGD